MLHEDLSQAAAFISNLGETTQVVRLVFLFIDMFIGDLVIVSGLEHIVQREVDFLSDLSCMVGLGAAAMGYRLAFDNNSCFSR